MIKNLGKLTELEKKLRNLKKEKNLEKKLEKQGELFLKLLHTQKIVMVIQ